MVELKKFSKNGLTIIGIGEDAKMLEPMIVLKYLCSKANIKYLGKRVHTKERFAVTLVEYENEIYEMSAIAYSENCNTATFYKFYGVIEDTEAIENFKYCINYCNSELNNEVWLHLYFKADELEEAKRKQKELGEAFASLNEI